MTALAIQSDLGRRLKAAGFSKVRRSAWRRQQGAWLDEVEVQSSAFGPQVTVNLHCVDVGVQNELHRTIGWPGLALAFAVQERLGALVDGRDRWWDRASPSTSTEIATLYDTHGDAFLASLHSDDGIIRHIGPGRGMAGFHLAMHLARAGRRDSALSILDHYAKAERANWRNAGAAVRRLILESMDAGRPPLPIGAPKSP